MAQIDQCCPNRVTSYGTVRRKSAGKRGVECGLCQYPPHTFRGRRRPVKQSYIYAVRKVNNMVFYVVNKYGYIRANIVRKVSNMVLYVQSTCTVISVRTESGKEGVKKNSQADCEHSVTITMYFINPSGNLKLSFDRTTKNISQ